MLDKQIIKNSTAYIKLCIIGKPQQASHPRPPDFHADLWGNSRGSSLCKFLHYFPAEIQGKWRRIFYVDISGSFPCGIPGDISLGFPSEISKFSLMTWEGFKSCENIPVMTRCHALVNYKVYRFGETSLSFQPRFRKFTCISTRILVSLTTLISAWILSPNNPNPWGFPMESARFCPLGPLASRVQKLAFQWF